MASGTSAVGDALAPWSNRIRCRADGLRCKCVCGWFGVVSTLCLVAFCPFCSFWCLSARLGEAMYPNLLGKEGTFEFKGILETGTYKFRDIIPYLSMQSVAAAGHLCMPGCDPVAEQSSRRLLCAEVLLHHCMAERLKNRQVLSTISLQETFWA